MTRWLGRDIRAGIAVMVSRSGLALLVCALAAVARGQAPENKVHLVLSAKPLKKAPPRNTESRSDVWLLRPNIQQEVLTYLRNDDPSQMPTVTVQLLADGVEVAAPQKVTMKETFVPVTWVRPGAAPNAPVVLAELKRPVVLRLLDGDGKKQLESVEFDIRRPSEYLKATLKYGSSAEGNDNRLIATVSPTEAFQGPPCRVELVLDPDRIPGLAPRKKIHVYTGQVTRPRQPDAVEDASAYLVAEGVRLHQGESEKKSEEKGVASIRADGYDRAFLFYTEFPKDATQQEGAPKVTNRILRINVPTMADPRKPLRVNLEADNVETPDTKRLVLDRMIVVDQGKERFSQLAEFSGDRSKRLFYAVGGPNQGLLFKPEVKDWSTDVDLNGLRGKIILRLRLFNDKNEALEILGTDKKEIRKDIILDDAPPEDVHFEKVPPKAVRGKLLPVSASVIAGPSGVQDVVFFLGKAAPDGKIPADAVIVPGDQAKKDGKIWEAELKIPKNQKTPVDVSVRATNGVGLSTTEVVTLEVMDPPVEVKPVKKATIAGTVTEGERPQSGLKVELVNAAGKVIGSATTKEGGTFGFKDLDPGTYQVTSAKSSSNTKGMSEVKLGDKEDKTGVVIKLWR